MRKIIFTQRREVAKKMNQSLVASRQNIKMVFLVYLVKYRTVNPKNRVRFPKTPKITEKITVVVYPPWTREVVGSNPTSQTVLLRFKEAEVQRLKGTKVQRFKGIELQRF
jgi:hypothetical protein